MMSDLWINNFLILGSQKILLVLSNKAIGNIERYTFKNQQGREKEIRQSNRWM